MTDQEINTKEAIERLRAQVTIKFDNQHDDDQDYDILAVCDYAEKASKVVEAAREEVDMECSDPEYLPQIRKALAAMEEQ